MARLVIATLLLAACAAPVSAKPSPEWVARVRSDIQRVESELSAAEDLTEVARRLYTVHHPVPPARARIFQVLAERGVGVEDLAIEAMVRDFDPRVRQAAARLLGATGGEASREPLRQVGLTDEDSSYNTGCFLVSANAREAATAALQELEARLGAATTPGSWLNAAAEEPAR